MNFIAWLYSLLNTSFINGYTLYDISHLATVQTCGISLVTPVSVVLICHSCLVSPKVLNDFKSRYTTTKPMNVNDPQFHLLSHLFTFVVLFYVSDNKDCHFQTSISHLQWSTSSRWKTPMSGILFVAFFFYSLPNCYFVILNNIYI